MLTEPNDQFTFTHHSPSTSSVLVSLTQFPYLGCQSLTKDLSIAPIKPEEDRPCLSTFTNIEEPYSALDIDNPLPYKQHHDLRPSVQPSSVDILQFAGAEDHQSSSNTEGNPGVKEETPISQHG